MPLTEDDRRAMGERLKIARSLAGLSVRGVAAALPCSKTSVVDWEHGVLPDAPTRARLAELYGVDEERLFAEEHARVAAQRDLLNSA